VRAVPNHGKEKEKRNHDKEIEKPRQGGALLGRKKLEARNKGGPLLGRK